MTEPLVDLDQLPEPFRSNPGLLTGERVTIPVTVRIGMVTQDDAGKVELELELAGGGRTVTLERLLRIAQGDVPLAPP